MNIIFFLQGIMVSQAQHNSTAACSRLRLARRGGLISPWSVSLSAKPPPPVCTRVPGRGPTHTHNAPQSVGFSFGPKWKQIRGFDQYYDSSHNCKATQSVTNFYLLQNDVLCCSPFHPPWGSSSWISPWKQLVWTRTGWSNEVEAVSMSN